MNEVDAQGPPTLEEPVALTHGPYQPLWQLATVALTILGVAAALGLWTGAAATTESFVGAERLPWFGETPAALPGVQPTFDVPRTFDRGSDWPPYSLFGSGWFLLAALAAASAVWLFVLQRGQSRRVDATALVAACCALLGHVTFSRISEMAACSDRWCEPPYIAWRTAPTELKLPLALYFLACISAATAIVRIALKRTRGGIAMAGLALVSSALALFCMDAVFLAPHVLGSAENRPDAELAAAVNSRTWGPPHEHECHVIISSNGEVTVRAFGEYGAVLSQRDFPAAGAAQLEPILSAIDDAHRQLYVDPGGASFFGEDFVVAVLLTVAQDVPAGTVTPLLQGLVERGHLITFVEASPRVAGGTRRWLDVFLPPVLDAADPDDVAETPLLLELLQATEVHLPARVRAGEQIFQHAGAAASAGILPRSQDGLRDGLAGALRLQVQDGVPWRDVVHALDLFGRDTVLVP